MTLNLTNYNQKSCDIYCKVMTVQDVAEHFGLNPKTIKSIDKAFPGKGLGWTDCCDLKILAVDSTEL